MPTLLLVHHTPSDAVDEVRAALVDGATDDAIDDVDLVQRPALEARPDDVLAADAVLLLTTANFGYMSGALKHFFDTAFPTLEHATAGLPYALVVKGNSDGTGAIRAVESIASGCPGAGRDHRSSCSARRTTTGSPAAASSGPRSRPGLSVGAL
jgi:NAD(P)H-dependent FMN reductase